jgi:hypothetical protein
MKLSRFLCIIVVLVSFMFTNNSIGSSRYNEWTNGSIYTDTRIGNSMLRSNNSLFEVQSQIRQWELNTGLNMSNSIINSYADKLRKESEPFSMVFNYLVPTLVPNNFNKIGEKATRGFIRAVYESQGKTFNDIANIYRSFSAMNAKKMADAYMRMDDFNNKGMKYRAKEYYYSQPTNSAIMSAKRGAKIYNDTWKAMGTVIDVADKICLNFQRTVGYVGTAMQVMNPPIYLHEKTPYGWIGSGTYSTPNGIYNYNQNLTTTNRGSITRFHEEWGSTKFGNYSRQEVMVTPTLNKFESNMMNLFPVGSYFDPLSSTITTKTVFQGSYRIETYIGNGSSFTQTWQTGNYSDSWKSK